MTAGLFGAVARRVRFRHWAAATISLAALAAADQALAACTTSSSGGVTTITCENTVTTDTFVQDQNVASTTAYWYLFTNTINATVGPGRTITGKGLQIQALGANPITVTNNGVISHTIGETQNIFAVNGLAIYGNGGAVTYLGSGDATTNAHPTGNGTSVGLFIGTATTGGDVSIGSQAAPITGTYSGERAIQAQSGGLLNVWINGGTLNSTEPTGPISMQLQSRGNLVATMTGHSVVQGGIFASNSFTPFATSTASVTTDAIIGDIAHGPFIGLSVSGHNGSTVNLTAGATIYAYTGGVVMFGDAGETRITTAPGTLIQTTQTGGGLGVQLQPVTGTIVADFGGTINGDAGLYLVPANGTASITIQPGAVINGSQVGITVERIVPGNTGVVDILNLGTISSPVSAATFDGTLRIGNGGTTGVIAGNVFNSGSLIFNRSDAIIYGGVIAGIGTVTKQGAGTLTLSGANTYTGATTVSAGTLIVNGSLTSATTVAAGARLGGTGSTGALTVNGDFAPGATGAIGTFTVNGNLVFGAGSHFIVDIGSATNDRVNVTGTASLAGSLSALGAGGTFAPGSSYTLLNAAGGVSGTFSPLATTPNALVTLRYDANNVFLDVAQTTVTTTATDRTTLVFLTPTVTTNQTSIFSTRLLGRLEGGTPLYDQTFALSFQNATVQAGVTAARAAITTAGGPGVIIGDPVRTARTVTSQTVTGASSYALASNTVTTAIETTVGPGSIQTGAVTGCQGAAQALAGGPSATRPACTANPTTTVVPLGNTNLNTASTGEYRISETRTDTVTETTNETWEVTGQVAAVGTIHAEAQSGLLDLGGRMLGRLAEAQAGPAGWGEVYGFRVSQTGRRDAWGLAGGVGLTLGEGLTLVLGADRGQLDIKLPGAVEDGDVGLTELGSALRWDRGPFSATAAVVYGFGDVQTRRTIIGSSRADYDVRMAGAALGLSYGIEAGDWTVRPRVRADFMRLTSDGFTETDTLGLVVAEAHTDRLRGAAGVEVERDFGRFTFAANADYLAVLDGRERSLPVAFAVAPNHVLDMRGPDEPNGLLVGARVVVPVSSNARIYLGYDGRFGGDYESHAGVVGVRIGL